MFREMRRNRQSLSISETLEILKNGTSGTVFDGLAQRPYKKIYLLFGINEIGYDKTAFINAYSSMLDRVISMHPDATVYVMSLTPVSKEKSDSSSTFNMTRIYAFNEALSSLAAEKGCRYLDLCSALAGPDGYLPAEHTFDGIHFTPGVYQSWLAYLKANQF